LHAAGDPSEAQEIWDCEVVDDYGKYLFWISVWVRERALKYEPAGNVGFETIISASLSEANGSLRTTLALCGFCLDLDIAGRVLDG
jgi:hypothetical protein